MKRSGLVSLLAPKVQPNTAQGKRSAALGYCLAPFHGALEFGHFASQGRRRHSLLAQSARFKPIAFQAISFERHRAAGPIHTSLGQRPRFSMYRMPEG